MFIPFWTPSITQNAGARPGWGIFLIQSQFMFGKGDALRKGEGHGQD